MKITIEIGESYLLDDGIMEAIVNLIAAQKKALEEICMAQDRRDQAAQVEAEMAPEAPSQRLFYSVALPPQEAEAQPLPPREFLPPRELLFPPPPEAPFVPTPRIAELPVEKAEELYE